MPVLNVDSYKEESAFENLEESPLELSFISGYSLIPRFSKRASTGTSSVNNFLIALLSVKVRLDFV